jgi:hypothetical protein
MTIAKAASLKRGAFPRILSFDFGRHVLTHCHLLAKSVSIEVVRNPLGASCDGAIRTRHPRF